MEQIHINFYGKHAEILKAAMLEFLTNDADVFINELECYMETKGVHKEKLRPYTVVNNNVDIAADD